MNAFDLVSTMDDEHYPTAETEERIKGYTGSVLEFFAELKHIWHLASWGWHESNGRNILRKPVRRFHISTAGWSGNETLIDAMRDNFLLWHLSWVQERVGGHYIFEVRNDATVPEVPTKVPTQEESGSEKPLSGLVWSRRSDLNR